MSRLLPFILKAVSWCLDQLNNSSSSQINGLVLGPLNDGTGSGAWAFNQAYFYAGLHEIGMALTEYAHAEGKPIDPLAPRALEAARSLRQAVWKTFNRASINSPLVQLKDQTWSPFVPTNALSPGRDIINWYPTEVDTGPLHLARLGAIDANDPMVEATLQDSEDNLFIHGWGSANEPVYDPQAQIYLDRDDPKGAIRAFYSLMASGFSHTVHEPVEHRWGQPQYFGPPSTDGAWMELYRNLIVREMNEKTLIVGQAIPRKWLENEKSIQVTQAPTVFGEISIRIKSHTKAEKIITEIKIPQSFSAERILVRLRHPAQKKITAVRINDRTSIDFDPIKEWVIISKPFNLKYRIETFY